MLFKCFSKKTWPDNAFTKMGGKWKQSTIVNETSCKTQNNIPLSYFFLQP